MLNKKQTVTISLVILEEDLKKIDKIIKQQKKYENRSDFIRKAISEKITK